MGGQRSGVMEGDLVLVYVSRKDRYVSEARRGEAIYTPKFVLRLDDVIGLPYGSRVKLKEGLEAVVTRPLLEDVVYAAFTRVTQVLYPKDIGMILVKSGIGPGSRVVEAGTGSGFLTAYLAHTVRPDGRVYSYELRPEFQEVARRNLSILGLDRFVTFKLKDIREGIDEDDVDAVVLDMPSPWAVVKHAYAKLRHGGSFVAFVPTVNQMERAALELRRHGFLDVEALELMAREYKVAPGETRPVTVSVTHTGFLVCARRP